MRLIKHLLLFGLFAYTGYCFAQSSPDKVIDVKVKTPKVISANNIAEAEVIIHIKDGWHINSNKPLDDNLSPTVVDLKANTDIKVLKIIYPEPLLTKLQFSQSQMALYEGDTPVKIQFKVIKGLKKKMIKLEGEVQYQPCNNQTCLFPASKPFTFELKLNK